MPKKIDVTKKPTPEQIEMLKKAEQMLIPEDDDYPEFTPDQLMEFKRISDERKSDRVKQNITLRLAPQAIKKAKSLGKGYTSILSRILERALDDPETIQRYL